MTTTEIARPMNETEARALTERIKAQAEHLWALLLEAHERQAWKALGYTRWSDYISGEFHKGRQWSYRLLDQAQVIREIENAAGMSPHGDIDEKTARDIKPLLPAVTGEIRARVAAGEKPAEAVRETVALARQVAQTRPVVRGELMLPASVGNTRTLSRKRSAVQVLPRVVEQVCGLADVVDRLDDVDAISPTQAESLADELSRALSVIRRVIPKLRERAA